mgnify:CR=1 FL=1
MKEIKEMYPSWGDDHGVRLGNVKISDLHDFKEHPSMLWKTLRCLNLQRALRIREY